MIKKLVRLLLFVLFVYVVILGVSGWMIKGEVDRAIESYDSLEQHMHDGDFAGAVEEARTMASIVDSIQRHTDTWWWDFARSVPVVGEDVDCAQRLATIFDDLANDAIIPLAEDLLEVASQPEDVNLGELLSYNVDHASQVAVSLRNARDMVEDCRTRIDELPKSHFTGLENLVGKTREIVILVDDNLDAFDTAIDIAGLIGEFVTS